MRLRILALAGAMAAFLVLGGTANADSGTFRGSITPTTCGPLQPVTVVAGETTIDAVAAETSRPTTSRSSCTTRAAR